jgi:hypothetical protein
MRNSSLARCASPEWNAAYEIRLATHYDFLKYHPSSKCPLNTFPSFFISAKGLTLIVRRNARTRQLKRLNFDFSFLHHRKLARTHPNGATGMITLENFSLPCSTAVQLLGYYQG